MKEGSTYDIFEEKIIFIDVYFKIGNYFVLLQRYLVRNSCTYKIHLYAQLF